MRTRNPPAGYRPVYVGETLLPTDIVWAGTCWMQVPGGQKLTPTLEEKFDIFRKITSAVPPTSDVFRE